MPEAIKITDMFGAALAQRLADKITASGAAFPSEQFVDEVAQKTEGKTYTQRVEIIADALRHCLPQDYPQAIAVLAKILGQENPNEDGMFREYYWLMPVGKFVEKYGLEYFDVSMDMIAEITKRNTGEYAVRPYIRRYPEQSLKVMTGWASDDNFHLRRLASEGLRPKLPWAPKLDNFIEQPRPVFDILDKLKADPVKFVQRSVANHLTDYLKVNPEPTRQLIDSWRQSDNPHTLWIIKRATRRIG